MKHIYTAIILLLLVFSQAAAQSDISTSITGKVLDKSTQKPMDYATVSIIEKETGKLLNGSITNSRGEFSITNIPYGIYKVNVSFLSYNNASIDSVEINNQKTSISLGTIYLSPSDVSLGEVAIVSDKPVIENKADKIVYNVSNDVTSQGGMAIDVLKKVPQVTVDADGNVELQGNSNIRFLINGKTSGIFGSNLADALSSIPASQIKSIEAITNPGARYDSQGTGGIINIILQDNKLQGVSGNVTLSAGSRLQNESFNLSVKRNNFGVNAFFGGNWLLRSDGSFSNHRETTDTTSGISTTLVQDGLNSFVRHGFRSGVGFEWNISKSNDLTGSVGYNQFSFRSSGLINMEQSLLDNSGTKLSDIFTLRNSDMKREFSSIDWNLDYKKSFKKEGHNLDILFNSSFGQPKSYFNQTQFIPGESLPYAGSTNNNPGSDKRLEISIDYANPVTRNFLFETGVKTTYQNLTSISDVSVFSPSADEYIADPLQSYDLKYRMMTYAGYLSTSFKLSKFLDLKPGARYEYTDVSIDYPNTSVPSYGTFVPSVVLSHNFNEKKSVQLSYSKRIERPEYNDLNPFINRSDPYNITTGNIFLKPEIGNNIELSYNSGFKKGGNLRISLMEHINSQEIQDFTVFYPEYAIGDSTYTNVLVTSRRNIGKEYNSGISLFGSVPVSRNLMLRGNLMVFHNYLASNLGAGNMSTGFRTRLNLNATYQLPRDLVVELFGFYRSAGRGLQGKTPQFFIYNLALRKKFWNQNGSLGFTATNPFSRNIRQVTTITTENSVSSSIRELPFRSFGLSFTYKFGKIEAVKRNQDENNALGPENTFN